MMLNYELKYFHLSLFQKLTVVWHVKPDEKLQWPLQIPSVFSLYA